MSKIKVSKRKQNSGEPIAISQVDLIAAIGNHLSKTYGDFPVIPRQFNTIIEAANLIVDAFATGRIICKPGDGLRAWFTSDDTGRSSLCMARRLRGKPKWDNLTPATDDEKDSYPRDPDDFGRCVRLLEVAPELRPYVSEMSACGPVWAALAGAWDELESLYRDELPSGNAPMLYGRMKELIDAASKEPTDA